MGQLGAIEARCSPDADAPAQPGLRERKKRLRMQRIISVSRQLFISKGFQNTTIQDIADEAGIGLGTLYLYANGKEDLLVLVFHETLLQLTEAAFDGIDPSEPVIDQLMCFFQVHIDYHKENRSLSRTVLRELSFPVNPQRRHDIELIFNTAYNKLAQSLKCNIEQEKLSPKLYIGTAVTSIFALFYHLLQSFLCDFFSEEEFQKNLRHALEMLLADSLTMSKS